MSKKYSLNTLFSKKRFVMVFSLVIAVIAWFIVSIQVSPTTEKTITDVAVNFQLDSITTTTALKAYSGSDAKIKVTVSGKKYVVDSLSDDDVSVIANLDNVTGSGNYTLSLIGKKTNSDSDFSIVNVEPSSVAVELDSEVTKQIDLKVNLVGATIGTAGTSGESLLLENELVNTEQKSLTVTGPSKEIEKIVSAEAYSEVNRQLSESQQITARIRLFDADGNVIYDPQSAENSQLKYTQLSFSTAPVMANVYLQKTVPLTVSTKNAPAVLPVMRIYDAIPKATGGYEEVSTIRIKGPQDKVNSITSILLGGVVDFSAITPNISSSFSVNMPLPDYSDVVFSDYKNTSDVSFDVVVEESGLTTKFFNVPDENINVYVAQTGVTATIQSALKGITVVGPSSVLKNLDASAIFANVTVSETTSGTYVKTVDFSIKGADSCWVYGSYELTLKIS